MDEENLSFWALKVLENAGLLILHILFFSLSLPRYVVAHDDKLMLIVLIKSFFTHVL